MNTQNCIAQQTVCSAGKSGRPLLCWWKNIAATWRRWNELASQRRQLRAMDDHMLKDIGLSRADVERIAGHRWFWEDPLNRLEDLDQRYRSSNPGWWR